ncbi:MAG: hypothetical protein HYW37_00365 [Candidatus Colwellbacteria bacterium]|nr:hypothetical protein [Candidatus Colwellbacteria bacterium]
MGHSTHFTDSACLAILELGRLMERGEIPKTTWDFMNPTPIEYGDWQPLPSSFQKFGRAKTMKRVIEFHGPRFRVRMYFTGYEVEIDGKTKTHWFIERVDRELRGLKNSSHLHPGMRMVWAEQLPRQTYGPGVEHLDIPKVHDNTIEFRKR